MAGLLDDTSGFGGLLGNPLFNMGLGILAASGRPNQTLGGALGQGGLLGLNTYNQFRQIDALNQYRKQQGDLAKANLALKLSEAPKVETAFDPTGRETRMMWDPNQRKFVPLGGAKTDILTPEAEAQKVRIAQASKPETTVRVENQMGASLAKNIGDIVQGTRESAMGALETLDTVGRIRAAMPNANLGPAATLRQSADQFAYMLGVGGSTTEERLANTRSVIKGLAELSLNARKALKGQGQVSDFEGKLLERAASGNVDQFTAPELEALLNVTDRLARKQYEAHASNLERLRGNESYKDLAPFYEVPPLPAASSAPKSGNPYASKSDEEILRDLRAKGYIK